MSTFPTTLDSFTDPTATSKLNSPSHSQQHVNLNDAVEKIEAKVGATDSDVSTSLDYKITPRELTETDGATVTLDCTKRGVHVLTSTDLAGDTRAIAFSGGTVGQAVVLKLIEGAGAAAGQALTYTGVTWVGGTAPTLVTTAGKINLIGFLMTSATTALGMPMGDF